MHELLGLPYSPWTEKARWALDARRVSYRFRHYQPLVGEPALRARLARWSGPVSVPVLLVEGGPAIADSERIARWADTPAAGGSGAPLFARDEDARIARWVALSESALAAGRSLALARLLRDRAGLVEMVPRGLRALLGPLAATVGRAGVARTLRKYGGRQDEHAARSKIAAAFDEARAALAASGSDPPTLGKTFGFADIAMAQTLLFVAPPTGAVRLGPVRLGEASARSFADPELSARFADVIRWRDALYAARRGSAPPATHAP